MNDELKDDAMTSGSHAAASDNALLPEADFTEKAKQESQRESLQVEKISNIFRFSLAVIGAILAFSIRNTIPEQSAMSVYLASAILVIHSIILAIILADRRLLSSKWLRIVQHISSTADVLVISILLWNLGEYRTFKSHIFQIYFLFIALAAFRYSRSLTIFIATISSAMYIGMFVVAIWTGRIEVGTLSEEYVRPVISFVGVFGKSLILIMTSVVMSNTAKGYSSVIARVVQTEREKEQQKQNAASVLNVLTRYFTRDVAEHILRSDWSLSGERTEVTVMFCDFREFTKLTSGMPTEQVVTILNRYLSEMVDIIFDYRGTLDKYMGDGFMAVFGAPIRSEEDIRNALRAALKIKKCVAKLNTEYSTLVGGGITVGIGISTGEVIAGNIGSKRRMEYTVVGETVNIAARLEKLNKRLNSTILISDVTYQKAQEFAKTKRHGKFQIRGISEAVSVHELIDVSNTPVATHVNVDPLR